MTGRILVVDDDRSIRNLLLEALKQWGHEVKAAGSGEEALKEIEEGFDVVLLDVKLPGISGIEALDKIKRLSPATVVVLMTAHVSRAAAVDALRKGAYDFFVKPFQLNELEVVVRRAVERKKLSDDIRQLNLDRWERSQSPTIIGESQAIRRVIEVVTLVADSDSTVLITGETGSGKELIATTIHELSLRRDKPFVKLNCAAIPEGLLESELFGHEKGAFTGAITRREGKFEAANGGTLLLDEIGDMSPLTQAKLLRVLQEKEFERIGSNKAIRVDVRLIAATNQDLTQKVAEGRFREDLYYRLNVFAVRMPPLREREEDISALATHFLEEIGRKLNLPVPGITVEAMQRLMAYPWPGNVRELKNVIERAVVLCQGEMIGLNHLAQNISETHPVDDKEPAYAISPFSSAESLGKTLVQTEKSLIEKALAQTAGVQTRAAKLLGLTKKNLWYKIRKHKIDPERFKNGN